ncbi:MAG: aminotransferase class I/II-fold pyridoxal phosphate-dependent enzyme, partial [Acidobacteriaceae bacterium]|nr:aminotransferase class I/II-fold pyridoxal phosphate-dependent enzyme [Acidobacteriaceae bacterium]
MDRAIVWQFHWTICFMSKGVSAFELTLADRPRHQTIANWLYSELRSAILDGRLRAGSRVPASRDFAQQYGLSRGTVVSVFERLQAEGYISSRVGSGTWVNQVQPVQPVSAKRSRPPLYIRRVVSSYVRPKPFVDLEMPDGTRPFCMRDAAVAEFPAELWSSIAARRARTFNSWLRTEDDLRGYRPLREAIAHYLGYSRGVRCSADQVVLVSGVQQALDLLARLLLKPDQPVWME